MGRVDPIAAAECQSILCTWLENDVDPQFTQYFISEVRNIAGVYKNTLTERIPLITRLAMNGDLKVSDTAKLILNYYNNSSELYIPESFLTNQEDIYGRVMQLLVEHEQKIDTMIDSKVDAKYSDMDAKIATHVNTAVDGKIHAVTEQVSQLTTKTEHIEHSIAATQEILSDTITLVATNVTHIGDRINILEVASHNQDLRINTIETSLTDLAVIVEKNSIAMKQFISQVVKKTPLPYSYEMTGTVRRKLVLKFKCAKGKCEFNWEMLCSKQACCFL